MLLKSKLKISAFVWIFEVFDDEEVLDVLVNTGGGTFPIMTILSFYAGNLIYASPM